MENQRHLYDDNEQTVRLQGLPLKKENMFIGKTSQWAWGFAFSTLPRRFYHLKWASLCYKRPSSLPGDKWLAVQDGWHHRDSVSQWLRLLL